MGLRQRLLLLAAVGMATTVGVGGLGVATMTSLLRQERKVENLRNLGETELTLDELNESLRADVLARDPRRPASVEAVVTARADAEELRQVARAGRPGAAPRRTRLR
jgi:hypothetical protein